MKNRIQLKGLAVAVLLSYSVVASIAAKTLPQQTMSHLLLTDAAQVGKRIVAVGDRGTIIYSDDHAASWLPANAPDGALLTSVFFIDDKQGWAAGHDAIILHTVDAGATWTAQFSAPNEFRPLLSILFVDDQHGIAVGASFAFYETFDAGKTWKPRTIIEPVKTKDGIPPPEKHYNRIVKLKSNHLLIVGEAGTILKSDDAGANWKELDAPYKGSYFGAVIADDGAIIIYGLRGKIFRSTDEGKTWKSIDNASFASVMGSTTLADGSIVLAGLAGVALISRDNGQSFVRFNTNTTKAFSAALDGDKSGVMLFGETGMRTVSIAAKP